MNGGYMYKQYHFLGLVIITCTFSLAMEQTLDDKIATVSKRLKYYSDKITQGIVNIHAVESTNLENVKQNIITLLTMQKNLLATLQDKVQTHTLTHEIRNQIIHDYARNKELIIKIYALYAPIKKHGTESTMAETESKAKDIEEDNDINYLIERFENFKNQKTDTTNTDDSGIRRYEFGLSYNM